MSTRLRTTRHEATPLRSPGDTPAGIVRVAAVQMASGPHVEANLNEAGRLIEIAAEQGAKLVGLPEYFGIMGLRDDDASKSWNSSHPSRGGCNVEALKSSGGAGLLYCFAAR